MNYIHHNYFSAKLTPEEKATKNAFENMLDCLAEELKDAGLESSDLIDLIEEVIENTDYIFNVVEEGIYSD
jgi:hypothetical protein